MSWNEVAILFGVLQCNLLTALYFFHYQLGASRKWLAALSFALGLVLLDSFSSQRGLHQEFPHIVGLVFPLNLVFAPLLYGYVSHLLRKQVRRSFFWHFAPFALSILLLFPFFLQSSTQKAALLSTAVTDQVPWYLTPGVLFVVVVTLLQGPIYLWLCIRQTSRTIKSLKGFYSSPSKVTLAWVIALQAAFFLFWLLDVTYLILDNAGVMDFPINEISDVILLCIVTVITVLGFQKQTLFEPMIQHLEYREGEEAETRLDIFSANKLMNEGAEKSTTKYEKSSLTAPLSEALFKELSLYMESHQSYLDPDLFLNQLAEETGHSLHNISQAINQNQQLNFFDYVNRYRVEAVKALLVAEPSMPIIDIGLRSGFNSKSAFYAAFRKQTGVTPSQFRKSGLTGKVNI